MSEHPRQFLPSEWLDEYTPSPQSDVNDFVRQLPTGEFWIGPAGDEWDDYCDDHNQFYRTALTDGQIIKFSALEIYENITLDVYADSYEHFPNLVVHANNFRLEDGESEDVFESLERLVAEHGGQRLAEGTYEVECWWWSEEDFSYRFVIGPDGKGSLQPCEGVN
ncbi:hypothetical protein G6L14_10760 [Agrobacterium vitis]|uniref:hypothetical protein n=1 Tax=Agrobacterium vitis TaxID=373 RepID=UPI0015729367|nr:hypothetical protein [Agrobacterium vitis]NSY12495.1 hypothetical protein [Agrobacterium vitis]